MQVPGEPGVVISAAQQTNPSSQAPSVPVVQAHPSPVQGQSLEQVPVPPGWLAPVQQRPSSQAPSVPEVQSQPSLVHGGLHSSSVAQWPEPPG